jgi:deoxyribonuclease V
MDLPPPPDLALSPSEAVARQRELAGRVRQEPLPPLATVAGVDVSVREGEVRAAIVVLSFPELEVVDHATWEGPVAFPYVPGLLSFRELPAIWPALEGLRSRRTPSSSTRRGGPTPGGSGWRATSGCCWTGPPWGSQSLCS